jgi:hypothetical protein
VRNKPLPAIVYVGASLVAHVALYAWVRWAWSLPDPGFKLNLPDTIELGMVEGTPEIESPPPAAAPEPTPAARPAAASAATAEGDKPKPKPPKKPRSQARGGPDAATRESVAKNGLAALSPPGAQLAMRVDLDALRDSPLSDDVRELLAGLPDVRALLDGSDIEPLRDLSRLFLASPNLQRSKVVLAGRYNGDETLPRQAAENLARVRGVTREWHTQGSIPVVAWENPDSTERVLALIGPGLFTITRADDLPRVLGIAEALAQRSKRVRPASGAEALLEMGKGQVLTFTAENAKLFARGATEHVPDRLVVAVHAPAGEEMRLTAQAEFASEPQAEHALEFWDGMRQRYARSTILAVLGISGLLERTTLERSGSNLELRSMLQLAEARLILRFVRDSLANRRPRPTDSPAPFDPRLAR